MEKNGEIRPDITPLEQGTEMAEKMAQLKRLFPLAGEEFYEEHLTKRTAEVAKEACCRPDCCKKQ